ncbi:MAG: WYL domain-containing protein [Deltaproteobacteria bacterium]|nr:WYL domain-containing protein [Deltaproteobacteria bacterium]
MGSAGHSVRRAELRDDTFEPDPSFDPAAFARQGFGVFHGPTCGFVIDFDEAVAHLVRERRYHHSQELHELPGGVRLTMTASGLPEVASWVAGFGGQARPVAPPELVEAVARLHREGLRRMGFDLG